MGGFGALDLARLAPQRFCAVGAHSAALWARGADTPAGAFDDEEDFARHNLLRFAQTKKLYPSKVWIDVGAKIRSYRPTRHWPASCEATERESDSPSTALIAASGRWRVSPLLSAACAYKRTSFASN